MSLAGDARRASARDPSSPRSLHLWFGTLAPPLAWASHLLLADALYELGCGPAFVRRQVYGLPFDVWAVLQTALFLTVDVLAGLVALRAYRAIKGSAPAEDGTRLGRARGMAVAGMASSVLYGLLLVYGLLPPFFLSTCGPS